MAKRRSGWSRLSPAYRKRLQGAGVDRKTWESGVDLRQARGHRPARAVPRQATPEQVSQWYPTRPQWERGLPEDLAAPMSVLRPPSQWTYAEPIPYVGDTWQFRVEYKDGTHQIVDIPHAAAGDLMDWLNLQTDSRGDPLDWEVGTSP